MVRRTWGSSSRGGATPSPPEDADQRLVLTPYGRGLVIHTRRTGIGGGGDSEKKNGGTTTTSGSNGSSSDVEAAARSPPSNTNSTQEVYAAIQATKKRSGSSKKKKKEEEEGNDGNDDDGDYDGCGTNTTTPIQRMQVVQLVEWDISTKLGKSGTAHPTLYTTSYLPSVRPQMGDDVLCQYGRGRLVDIIRIDEEEEEDVLLDGNSEELPTTDVVAEKKATENGSSTNINGDEGDDDHGEEKKESHNPSPNSQTTDEEQTTPTVAESTNANRSMLLSQKKQQQQRRRHSSLRYVVQLSSWRLANRSNVKCYLSQSDVHVLRKKTLGEMTNIHERVEYAQNQKSFATKQFQQKQYFRALELYGSAVDAVRFVQHDNSSDNVLRADLLEVMVTCCNNAATCCAKLNRWSETSQFAKNALLLLDALYAKRGMRIHAILQKGGCDDTKLFGEWRVKSLLLMARADAEGKEYDDAIEGLRVAQQAHRDFAPGGNDDGGAAVKMTGTFAAQEKEIRRLLHVCTQRKKAVLKKEKQRAQAMFGGGGGKTTVGAKTTKASPGKGSAKEKKQNAGVNAATDLTAAAGGTEQLSGLDKKMSMSHVNGAVGGVHRKKKGVKKVTIAENENRSHQLPPPPSNLDDDRTTIRSRGNEDDIDDMNVKQSDLFLGVGGRGSRGGGDFQPSNDNEDLDGGEVPDYSDDEEEEEESWFDEHKEALILSGACGLLAFSFALLRGSSRR